MKNKWITSMLTILLFSNIFAQDNTGKSFRFGLRGNVSTDWLSPDNLKEFSNAGVGLGYGWGFQMEFKLGESTTSLATGMSLTTFAGSLNYNDESLVAHHPTYYALNNFEFVEWNEGLFPVDTMNAYELYQLKERKYKINYVTLPISLKMKTKEIGYFTYFGEFGANIGLKTKTRVNDICDKLEWDTLGLDFNIIDVDHAENSDLDLAKGTQPIRVGLLVGGGAEYNISGSTSLFFALHYHYFVTNALTRTQSEDYLRELNSTTGQFENVGAKAIPGSVSLTVGVLF